MIPVLFGAVLQFVLGFLMFSTALFLILLILVQRGRGGGLTGALGGMGGQSAFGTKAGDVFTRVTIGVATLWILLCLLSIALLNDSGSKLANTSRGPVPGMTGRPSGSTDATNTGGAATPGTGASATPNGEPGLGAEGTASPSPGEGSSSAGEGGTAAPANTNSAGSGGGASPAGDAGASANPGE